MGGFHGPCVLPRLHWPELSLVSHLTRRRLGSGGQHMPQVVGPDPRCSMCHDLLVACGTCKFLKMSFQA